VRLDLALIRQHPELSRRRARDAIEKGQVSVDGRALREPGAAVSASSVIVWNPHQKALPRARLSLPVLYEDETLLIVDKPAGLLTVPTSPDARDEDTALARLQHYVRRLHPRRPYVGVVHRIDRGTSGAVAFALREDARQALRRLFREHRIERRYAAIVVGQPRADAGEVDLPIYDVYQGGRRRVARPGEPSRPALTRFKVVERIRGLALLEVELETGRQHQIRVHLAHVGLPILGDPVYRDRAAGRPPVQAGRPMLHARHLAFEHPLTGAAVRAEAPLPADFQAALRELRRLSSRGRPGG
jgi:23S rRNA pseudouridine1911/1915/1917 synthase